VTYDEATRQFRLLHAVAANSRRVLDDARDAAAGTARVLRLASDAARAKPADARVLHLHAAAAESFDRARDAVRAAEDAHAADWRVLERAVVVMNIVRERGEAA
jgi:hypothetical protein